MTHVWVSGRVTGSVPSTRVPGSLRRQWAEGPGQGLLGPPARTQHPPGDPCGLGSPKSRPSAREGCGFALTRAQWDAPGVTRPGGAFLPTRCHPGGPWGHVPEPSPPKRGLFFSRMTRVHEAVRFYFLLDIYSSTDSSNTKANSGKDEARRRNGTRSQRVTTEARHTGGSERRLAPHGRRRVDARAGGRDCRRTSFSHPFLVVVVQLEGTVGGQRDVCFLSKINNRKGIFKP